MAMLKTLFCASLLLAAADSYAIFGKTTVAPPPPPPAPPPAKASESKVLTEPKRTWTGLFITGDYLYWKTSVTGWPYAVEAIFNGSVFDHLEKETVKNINFPYQQGWRAGAGIRFDRGWDLAGRWTHLHSNEGASLHAEGDKIIEAIWAYAFAPGEISRLHAHQFMHYDEVGLNFVKSMFLGSHFSFSPYFGAIGAQIHQGMSLNSDVDAGGIGQAAHSVKIKNNFRGAGIQAGCGAAVVPVRWFSIFGNASYSLLYGEYLLRRHDAFSFDNAGVLETFPLHEDETLHALASAFNLRGGIKFSWLTAGEKFEFYVEGAYEFLFWPGQVKMYRILSDLTQAFTLLGSGDIGFQGATGGFGMRF